MATMLEPLGRSLRQPRQPLDCRSSVSSGTVGLSTPAPADKLAGNCTLSPHCGTGALQLTLGR